MRRIRQRAIAVVALCALSSTVSPEVPVLGSFLVLAQEPSALPSADPGGGSVTPAGMWYGFSVGWGWSRVGCDVCRGLSNEDGPEVWYTDPFGKNARSEPFPGSVRQYIARTDNVLAVNPSGPTFGQQREYGGSSVHAPN